VEFDHQSAEVARVIRGWVRRWGGRLRVTAPAAAATVAAEPMPPVVPPTAHEVDALRARAPLYGAADLDAVKAMFPARVASCRDVAERIVRHEFDLLGSGPYTPVDPDRRATSGYEPIDWYLDPVRQLRFPRGIPHKEWKLYEHRPANADIKYPWELARCQHWPVLAQGFLFTRDDRYAGEVARQLDDFVEANPLGLGINWTCTMDVALRAVNWVVALDLLRASALDDGFWMRAYTALLEHGTFIRYNLENTYEVTSNHFLSNVVGLWYLGHRFAELPAGQEWLAFARRSLEQEIEVQVLPDGADFESSVPYHRLVTELFMGASRVADLNGEPLSSSYRARTRQMVSYLADVLRPDGLMPQIGDADDGRLHQFGGYGVATPQDARHLFGPASFMFDVAEWQALGGEAGAWEAVWWGYPARAARAVAPPPVHVLHKDAGLAISRDQGNYLLITNGIVGTKGFGNHKHNDQLSFEYHVDGSPVVVDPGSFVYTSDPDARNLFRSTRYHNTLQIDGAEQNRINPEWLFRMFEGANAEHVRFERHGTQTIYRGRHSGYTALPAAVQHERRFSFDTASGVLELRDTLIGEAEHALAWHFHFAPGAQARADAGACVITSGAATVRLSFDPRLSAALADAWYSPSYGVRVPCMALTLSATDRVNTRAEWTFILQPVPRA
jgi:uncharacterized heparinase superfamily protein